MNKPTQEEWSAAYWAAARHPRVLDLQNRARAWREEGDHTVAGMLEKDAANRFQYEQRKLVEAAVSKRASA